LMYWSVLGCIVGVEYVAEWAVSWIPFYYTTKTLFLLYLALPQTRGSSYLYINHLQPFFHTYENQIDATIASLKARLYAFVQEKLRTLWDQVAQTVGQQPQQQPAAAPIEGTGPGALISTFWRSYGPTIIATGAALLPKPTEQSGRSNTASNAFHTPGTTPTPSYIRMATRTTQSALERKRQLEAELAALSREIDSSASGTPIPPASSSMNSRASSASDINVRGRTTSGSGRFEEIEVPSDVEGYDVGDVYHAGGSDRPGGHKKGGTWFGWGSAGSKGGYERVKND